MLEYFFCENLVHAEQPNLFSSVDIKDKTSLRRFHMLNMMRKTRGMFEYKGLPIEIPSRVLELLIQTNGFCVIFKHNGKLYSSYAGLGGEPNYNYMPTLAIVNNPYLGVSRSFKIDEECVVIPNDSLYYGLTNINAYYSQLLTENDLSLNALLINSRAMNLLYATNDDDYHNILDTIKDLEDGKLSAILSKSFSQEEQPNSLPFGSGNSSQTIVQLLEERQYIKGSWWNELGVQSNYNMKRETITSSENILNVDSLLPLTDDMYNMRKEAIEKVNKMFGVNWSFDFGGTWKKLRTEIKLKEEINANEANKDSLQNRPKEKGGEDNGEQVESNEE